MENNSRNSAFLALALLAGTFRVHAQPAERVEDLAAQPMAAFGEAVRPARAVVPVQAGEVKEEGKEKLSEQLELAKRIIRVTRSPEPKWHAALMSGSHRDNFWNRMRRFHTWSSRVRTVDSEKSALGLFLIALASPVVASLDCIYALERYPGFGYVGNVIVGILAGLLCAPIVCAWNLLSAIGQALQLNFWK